MPSLDRAALTARYLDEVRRRGLTAGDLLGPLPDSELLRLRYGGRYLSRPLFIGQAELAQLYADVEAVLRALASLPGRLYDGDLAAYARAVGANEVQVQAVLRGAGAPATKLARADLYADSTGFRLLEFNIGSGIGGMDNADMCRGLLAHPLLAEFAREHGLGHVDSMREHVANVLAETGTDPRSFPMVAVAASPALYPSIGPYLRTLARRWLDLGLDAHACQVGDLQVGNGRMWLGDRVVDILYRVFLIDDVAEPEDLAVIGPLLDAVARGEVKMFTSLVSELAGNKSALAMLSDDRNRHLFDDAELASFDRILPWTRMVAAGPVTLEDGSRVDLLDYAVAQQDDLVLKPALLHSGVGVLLGWHPSTSPGLWRERLAEAVAAPGSCVLQRRVRPSPELFPGDAGELVPWIVTWGVYSGVNGYSGMFTRGATLASDMAVINADQGASAGSCLLTLAGP